MSQKYRTVLLGISINKNKIISLSHFKLKNKMKIYLSLQE